MYLCRHQSSAILTSGHPNLRNSLTKKSNVTRSFPDYTDPPVIEVVCGINFLPLEKFKAIHIGLFWERLKAEFPETQEHSPLTSTIEQFAVPPPPPVTDVQLLQTPPLPRVWFLDKPGNGIVQVQRDAFLHNWRKLDPKDKYPRFRVVVSDFKKQFEIFRKFAAEFSLGEIAPLQCELTYVNHISENPFWSANSHVGALFPDFAWRRDDKRFLPGYEGATIRVPFRLPNNAGRLYTSIQTGFRRADNSPVLVLEMKCRGMPVDTSLNGIWGWFELAHEWIVRGFADLTDAKAQKELWGFKG
jgi:uncharacterized protein (TIGR04255 family)